MTVGFSGVQGPAMAVVLGEMAFESGTEMWIEEAAGRMGVGQRQRISREIRRVPIRGMDCHGQPIKSRERTS
jgi:hypothetical protein